MKVSFVEKSQSKNKILCLSEEYQDSFYFQEIDSDLNGLISKIIENKEFKPEFGNSLIINTADNKHQTIYLLGTVSKDECDVMHYEKLGSKIVDFLKGNKILEAEIYSESNSAKIAFGAMLKSYSFNKYKSEEKTKNFVNLDNLTFVSMNIKQDLLEFNEYSNIAEAVAYTKDLVTEPGNVIYPESYAEKIKKDLSKLGIKVEILEQSKLKKLGMEALLGVGQGSAFPPKVVVMTYNGGKKNEKPLAFVGKGVTFDSGGLSLKPANSMEEMKYDMAGSAVVVGLMKLLALRKAKCNAVGIVGLVENMPDGAAQRPGDVVKTMSGQTVEVLNTDAEGRLVLADILWYCQEKFKPEVMVNLATLTGAIVVALGNEYAGLFSNSDKLSKELEMAGHEANEKLWRLPLSKEYDKSINSEIADMRNISNPQSGAGSIMAAQFLNRFIVKGTKWAHIDIAGTTWDRSGKDCCPKGATAFGVKLLNQFVKKYYES